MLWKKKQEDIKTVHRKDRKEKGTKHKIHKIYTEHIRTTTFVVCQAKEKYLTGLSCRNLLSYVYTVVSLQKKITKR
jgi:hypothetical protein